MVMWLAESRAAVQHVPRRGQTPGIVLRLIIWRVAARNRYNGLVIIGCRSLEMVADHLVEFRQYSTFDNRVFFFTGITICSIAMHFLWRTLLFPKRSKSFCWLEFTISSIMRMSQGVRHANIEISITVEQSTYSITLDCSSLKLS